MQLRHAIPPETATLPPHKPLSRAESIIAACLPSLGDLLFALLLLGGVLIQQGRALGTDGDVGWTLRLGLTTLTHGLPRSEPLLSTAAGQPLVDWEWLSQVLYAAADRLAGLNGVVVLAALLIALTVSSLLHILRRHGLSLLPALALTLAGFVLISITWTARAQLFSLPLTLWWVELLRRYWHDGSRRHLLWLPPMVALWANLHAGFLVALGYLALALVVAVAWPVARQSQRRRDLALTLAAVLLATLLTPWGFALPVHIVEYARNPLIAAHTQEFQPPDFHQWPARIFVALVGLLIALWYARRRPAADAGHVATPDAFLVLLTLVATVLALTYVRFLPLWPLIALPVIADAASGTVLWPELVRWLPLTEDAARRIQRIAHRIARLTTRLDATDELVGKGRWAAVSIAFVVLLALRGGSLPGANTPLLHATFDSQTFPVEAAAQLQREGLPPGEGFNTYEWGGYLEYALPGYHVFIDSRSDVYSQRVLSDYLRVIDLQPGWQQVLARYQVRWALLPTNEPLAQVLALEPGWRCVPEGGDGVAVRCEQQGATVGVAGLTPALHAVDVTPAELVRLSGGEQYAQQRRPGTSKNFPA